MGLIKTGKPNQKKATAKSTPKGASRNRLKTLQEASTTTRKRKNAVSSTPKAKKSTTTKKITTKKAAKPTQKGKIKAVTKTSPTKTAQTKGKGEKGAQTSPKAKNQEINKNKTPGQIKREKNLRPVKKGDPPLNPKGRPKKVLTRFSQYGYSKQEVRDTFAALAGMKSKELDEIIMDEDSTVLEVLAAREFKKSTKKRGGYSSSAKNMVEMFADKAVQHKVLEIDAKTKLNDLDDDELDAVIAKMKAKIAKDKQER